MRALNIHIFSFLMFFHIAVLFLIIPGTRCRSDLRQLEKRILDNLTKDGQYDKRIRPDGGVDPDGPVAVRVNFFVRSLSKIDENSMEYSLQLTFRQQWTDNRLQFDDFTGQLKYLTLTDHNSIWKPDIFFSNENRGHMHNLIQPNNLMRIYPSGQVLYSVRVSLVLSCPMDLRHFPLDTQTCSIIMASYGYTTDDIVFLWKEGDPVQITRTLQLLNFNLVKFMTDYCTSRTNTGEYSCLKVGLVFKRLSAYYVYQTYIPFAMLVILSWITFWIDKNQVTLRLFVAVAAMLGMAILSKGNNLSLPKTSYMTAIDIWTGACQLFAFGTLLEFALISFAYRRSKQQNLQKETGNSDPAGLLEANHSKDVKKEAQAEMENWRAWVGRFAEGPIMIDVLSRVLFPVTFAIFNIVYWTTYSSTNQE